MRIFKKYRMDDKTLLYKEQKMSFLEKMLRVVPMVACAVGMAFFYFWIYTSVLGFELPKTVILRKQNASWQAKIAILQHNMDACEDILRGLEDRDEGVYRAIFGLNSIPDEVRNAGFGGVNRYSSLEQLGAGSDLIETIRRQDILLKRTAVQSESLDGIHLLSTQAGDMASCLPAVPPIVPDKLTYHVSSSFGGRQDPISGGWRFHEGIDLAARIGTPVYATGDGVVEEVRYQFYGYGNVVVIDHGYGYKTRYAHLNSMLVTEGMKVSRGEQIAEMGNSGKSTGPHLHYEVIYKGKRVNPYNYFDLSMPVEEYQAMVAVRLEQSGSRMMTTGDVIRRISQ